MDSFATQSARLCECGRLPYRKEKAASMHAKVVPFALSSLFFALLSGPASAVEDQRVIRFSSTVTEPDIQNMITVIRSITGIQQVTAVAGQPAIALSGESAQIAAAGWIAGELDTPSQGIREDRRHLPCEAGGMRHHGHRRVHGIALKDREWTGGAVPRQRPPPRSACQCR